MYSNFLSAREVSVHFVSFVSVADRLPELSVAGLEPRTREWEALLVKQRFPESRSRFTTVFLLAVGAWTWELKAHWGLESLEHAFTLL